MGETTAIASGGNPLWRRCLPKTALHRCSLKTLGALSALRIKFATGRTSEICT
ncbi:hypothetical protein [Moorena sp. SIO4G3]|uniref:hypothetical protein n=1 Tax=Moorena sp. SIO4G3 TaxID=2607821 RepID=UPI00142A0087|nr:hypothetical protein [Moorena sp. SIO4G3]NEO77093.1 hypothetical protein [Moorena sp. SIO4G3]